MLKNVYAVKDELTGYLNIMLFQSKEEAIRSFKIMVNDETCIFNLAAEDYSLYEVGMFDEQTGEIFSQPIKQVAKAKQLKGAKDGV